MSLSRSSSSYRVKDSWQYRKGDIVLTRKRLTARVVQRNPRKAFNFLFIFLQPHGRVKPPGRRSRKFLYLLCQAQHCTLRIYSVCIESRESSKLIVAIHPPYFPDGLTVPSAWRRGRSSSAKFNVKTWRKSKLCCNLHFDGTHNPFPNHRDNIGHYLAFGRVYKLCFMQRKPRTCERDGAY